MATHLPAKIIDIHNTMVLELSENMTGPELKKLKRLLEDDPLTMADKNRIKTVQELFICLRNKAFISYGDYDKLVSKLKLVKPLLCSIVNQYTKDMSKILKPELEKDTKDEILISMDKSVYHTREGSEAAFVECTVLPVPENIVWKKGKSAPLRNLVPIDNRKYFYGPKAPTLVIKGPDKAIDEARYQCTAEAQGKVADGVIVQLQVSADETKVRETAINITPPSDDNSTPSVSESELAQPKRERESNKENESSEQVCGSESHTDTLPRGRKRPSSQTEDHSQIGVKRTTVSDADQGCRMSFNVMNDIDITRKESESDISDTFTRVTRQSGRLRKTELKTKCIQVCMCITAAERPSEPSSVHLAEIFKHFLLGGGKIHLSDESHTVLQVDETSLEITSQITLDDDFPYVNTSHGMFNVPVGKTAIIQTYVNASPAATSIQWFKLEDDEHIPIEIDNKIYFGGSVLSPTLIIRETHIDDQGQYMCTATNSNGTGSGNITVLSVQSCHELTSSPEPTEAALQFAVSEDFSLQKQRNIRKTAGKIRALKDIEKPPPIRIESQTTCNYHEGSQLDLYCEQCNYLICSKCLSTEEHRSHTTSKLCDITLNQKEDILNFIEKTENIELVHIDQCIASTETQLKENASNFDKLSEQIKIQSNILKEELDLLVAQTLSLYQQMADDNAKILQNYKHNLEIYSTQLKQTVQECKIALGRGCNIEMFVAGCKIHSLVTFPVEPILATASFSPSRKPQKYLEKALGIMETSRQEQGQESLGHGHAPHQSSETGKSTSGKQRFKGKMKTKSLGYTLMPTAKLLRTWENPCAITSVCPTTDSQVWTSDSGSFNLTLLDSSGNVIQVVKNNTRITDICLSPITNTLWVCDWENNITELVSGRLVHRFSTSDEPLCICVTASKNIIVGMQGHISKFTTKGKLVLTTLAIGTGKPLMCKPYRLSECPVTHNIAVVNLHNIFGFDEGKSCVVVMDTDFNELFTYGGEIPDAYRPTSYQGDETFEPRGVVYDSAGNLVIGDSCNKHVLLLSGSGAFLRIIYTDDDFTKAVAVDRTGVLWTLFGLCNIKLLRYHSAR